MTGHQVQSLTSELVLMAKAMEELPQVQHQLKDTQEALEGSRDTVQRLELKLMDAKNLEETLRSAIRDLEVARDDAELRFLEAEEQHGKIANAFQVALEAMDHADKIVARAHDALHPLPPPMPEPVISEVKPIAVDPTDAGKTEAVTLPDAVEQSEPVSGQSAVGQSDPLPTPAQPSPTGTGTESVASDTDPEPTKYDPDGNYSTAWWAWDARNWSRNRF